MFKKITRDDFLGQGCIALYTLFTCLTLAHAQVVPRDLKTIKTMALVSGGSFVMGSENGPEDEKPAHTVFVKAFLMDILPVSNADFARFLNQQGLQNLQAETFYDHLDSDARIHRRNSVWQADLTYESHAVNEVSWVGARDYCAWLKKRLPTEAEWEKAARGIDGRKYPWGNTAPNTKLALFGGLYNSSAPVDAYPDGASPYGVLDMAGNQWEWVSSIYQTYPYKADDGRENTHAGPVRSTRGGGHDSSAEEISTTQRGRLLSRNPRAGHHNIGFRCASNID